MYIIFATIFFGSMIYAILQITNFLFPNFMLTLYSMGSVFPYIFSGIILIGLIGIFFGGRDRDDK